MASHFNFIDYNSNKNYIPKAERDLCDFHGPTPVFKDNNDLFAIYQGSESSGPFIMDSESFQDPLDPTENQIRPELSFWDEECLKNEEEEKSVSQLTHQPDSPISNQLLWSASTPSTVQESSCRMTNEERPNIVEGLEKINEYLSKYGVKLNFLDSHRVQGSKIEWDQSGATIRLDFSGSKNTITTCMSEPSESTGPSDLEESPHPSETRDSWRSKTVDVGDDSRLLKVPLNVSDNKLIADYYKNFSKKLFDAYLIEFRLTDRSKGKQNPAAHHHEIIREKKLRDKASIKKITELWNGLTEFRNEFSEFVLRVSPSEIQRGQVGGKCDKKLLNECYKEMLAGLKAMMFHLRESNLLDKYEPKHFWPEIKFGRVKESLSNSPNFDCFLDFP